MQNQTFWLFQKISSVILLLALTLSLFRINLLAQTVDTSLSSQAVLGVNFTQAVSDSKVTRLLNQANSDRSLNIVTASSQITIGGKTQTFSWDNQDKLNFNDYFTSYQSAYRALLDTLVVLEQEESAGNVYYDELDEQTSEVLTDKYSTPELQKTKSQSPKIKLDTLTIAGSLKQLQSLKDSSFGGLAGDVVLIDNSKLKAELDETKLQLQSATSELERQVIIQESVKELTEELGLPEPQTPAIELNLSQEQIQAISTLTTTDPSGSVILSPNQLNQLNLSPDQKQAVEESIQQFNELPTGVKDGSDQALAEVMETPSFDKELSQETSLGTKLVRAVKGEVQAEAAWCNSRIPVRTYWWGHSAHINQCALDTIATSGNILSVIIGALGGTACSAICITIAAVIQIQIHYIQWLNSRCGGNGVMLYRNWSGQVWYWTVC
jgi:hypothetical protein